MTVTSDDTTTGSKPRLTKQNARKHAGDTFRRLQLAHPDAHCELQHDSPFQLIVATVLSAQSTDVAVNKATPALFSRWPDPTALAAAPMEEVQQALSTIGMFRQKAKNIIRLSQMLLDEHGGEVPRALEQLVALPGVGRKTANVVLGVAFSSPEGVVVDTHVQRITQRLAWTKHDAVEKIEQDLMKTFPRSVWDPISHTLIFHGRRVCTARSPACSACSITDACPSAFNAEHVGRKPPRSRVKSGGATAQNGPPKKKAIKKARKKTKAKKTPAKRALKKNAMKKSSEKKVAAMKDAPMKVANVRSKAK